MNNTQHQAILDRLIRETVKKKYIYGAVFCISSGDGSVDLISASGDIKEDSQYYIASINKLFVSALILRLVAQNRLDLHDKIEKFLPEEVMKGLHVHEGRDYSNQLAIVHLLSQTSGLPCYLIDRQDNGKREMSELEAGVDQAWPIDRVIQEIKKMNTHFPPGQRGMAKYIDTNHQILSVILENIIGEPINTILKNLFQELNLTKTYVCEEMDDKNFVPIRYKSETRNLPLFLTSTKNDIISTAKDQMTFIKAFFEGRFFPKERLKELEKWNRIFFPFQYGIGLQKFFLPRFLTLFRRVPEKIGHSGSYNGLSHLLPANQVRQYYTIGPCSQEFLMC